MVGTHTHHYYVLNFEPGIQKGICQAEGCGAVKFFPLEYEKEHGGEILKRVAELNRANGNKGAENMPEILPEQAQIGNKIGNSDSGETAALPKLVEVNLTREQKAAIAREAKERGIKVVAAEHKLDWKVVRAWVLTYCHFTSKGENSVRILGEREQTLNFREDNKELIIKDYNSMLLRVFLVKWHLSSKTWQTLREKWQVKSKFLIPVSRSRPALAKSEPDLTLLSKPKKEPDKVRQPDKREQKLKFLEENTELITKDYNSMRLPDFLVKWQMSIRTWQKLKKLQQIKGKGRHQAPSQKSVSQPDKISESIKPPDGNGLPPFPVFDSTWPMLVQIEWLQTYRKLARGTDAS